MPSDISTPTARRRAAATRAAADLRAILILFPLIMALVTVGLSMKSPAFAACVVGMEAE